MEEFVARIRRVAKVSLPEESNNLVEIGCPLPPLSAPFAPTLDKGYHPAGPHLANFELCTGSPFWALTPSPPFSVALDFSVQQ